MLYASIPAPAGAARASAATTRIARRRNTLFQAYRGPTRPSASATLPVRARDPVHRVVGAAAVPRGHEPAQDALERPAELLEHRAHRAVREVGRRLDAVRGVLGDQVGRQLGDGGAPVPTAALVLEDPDADLE